MPATPRSSNVDGQVQARRFTRLALRCPLLGSALALLSLATTAAPGALPEETLLSGLGGDLRHPGLRCEWVATRYETLDDELSLDREELTAFHVLVDGAKLGDSAAGAVLAVELEARDRHVLSAGVPLIGPLSRSIRSACR